jgi:hypothetical protein
MNRTHEEVADILDRAHDELLQRGWNQGDYEAEDGRVCLLGALAHATDIPAHQLFHSGNGACYAAFALAARLPCIIPDWNDAAERTEDEVFDLLRNTAKAEREEAGAA